MLSVQHVSKSYGAQVLFDDINLTIAAGERIGLVGRNGHGKSTLLRMMLGDETPDAGEIIRPRGYRIGHLAQHLHFTEATAVAEVCLGLPEEIREYSRYRAEAILMGLGFSAAQLERAPEQLSGGYQIRINLARLLVSEPNLLLLDEPTNYLDIVALRWLQRFLREWPHECLMISHDREFLDAVSTHTVAIHRGGVRKIAGSTEKVYAQLAHDEDVHERTRQNAAKQREQILEFAAKFRAKARGASQVQSRLKQLEKLPDLAAHSEAPALSVQFQHAAIDAKVAATAHNVSFGYDPQSALFSGLSLQLRTTDRLGVIGANGRGKSTLLRLLAGELTSSTGSLKWHPQAAIGYFGQTNIDRLADVRTVEQEIAAANPLLTRTQVRAICGAMLFPGDAAEKLIRVLSGGERSRVLLGTVLATPCNVLLLDEPTNHLDMYAVDELTAQLAEFPGAVVVVSHSEHLLRQLCTRLVVFEPSGVQVFDDTYDRFLEQVGWEEEQSDAGGTVAVNRQNKKLQRQAKAAELALRQATLGPLKRMIVDLEAEIMACEREQIDVRVALHAATDAQDIAAIRELAVHDGELTAQIEALFTDLERRSREYAAVENELA